MIVHKDCCTSFNRFVFSLAHSMKNTCNASTDMSLLLYLSVIALLIGEI